MPTINTFKHETDVDTFSEGQTIFSEGSPSYVMYIVQEREVNILVHDKLIETVGQGGVIGEIGLVDATAFSATAIAKSDCKLVALDATRFKIYVHNMPFFAIQVMRVMADRLRRMNELI